MKQKNTTEELAAQAARLDAIQDGDIDTSDIPPLGEGFWTNARLRRPGEKKEQVTLRLPPHVLRYFRARGKGYQTRISQVLEYFVDQQQREDGEINR